MINEIKMKLESIALKPNKETLSRLRSFGIKEINKPMLLMDLFKRHDFTKEDLRKLEHSFADYPDELLEEVESEIKYAGYIVREQNKIKESMRWEKFTMPVDFDYSVVPSLSKEGRERLMQVRPKSLAQAMRVSGVRPADIQMLLLYFKSGKK